jgi:hypothetical protein
MKATAVNNGKPVPTWSDFQIGTGKSSTSAVVRIQNATLANSIGSEMGFVVVNVTAMRLAASSTTHVSKVRTFRGLANRRPPREALASVIPPAIAVSEYAVQLEQAETGATSALRILL